MTNQKRQIALLTGGGDCAGLNAVIRAVVKTATIEYQWDVLGIENGFEGLILPGKVRKLSIEDVRGILPRGGTILGTTNRANPFAYEEVLPNGEVKITDRSDDVLKRLDELNIDGLIVIGGDGSLHITHELIQKGLHAVGVPKTIDNDIQGTQITFGFDTALNTAMEALDKLQTTAESHHRVLILEVMGRNTGWIALKAGIAGGANVILIPEIPFTLQEVANKVNERRQENAKFSLIVVAEGAKPVGGSQVYQEMYASTGMRRLGGIGAVIESGLSQLIENEIRVTVLGHLQRGGSPTAFDRLLASRYGCMAVRLVAERKFGQMVALRDDQIISIPISEAVASQKFVPLNTDIIATALSLNISLGNTRQEIESMMG
ncbi:MAG: ATP-dependent 6-phosphofructokinase [Anaerolineales bacterium]|nr:ATP-dependent 6-phosphofructokinase [Anaerolineales bacterium]